MPLIKQCKRSDTGKHKWTSEVMRNYTGNGKSKSTGVRVIYCSACGKSK